MTEVVQVGSVELLGSTTPLPCSIPRATGYAEETKADPVVVKPRSNRKNRATFQGRLVGSLNVPRTSCVSCKIRGRKAVDMGSVHVRGDGRSNVSEKSWPMDYLGLCELRDGEVYRAALIEFFGTMAFMCIHITAITTVMQGGYEHPTIPVCIVKGITLSLLIFAFANTSGGHFNPVITLSTMFTGLTPIARGLLYMVAQCLGAMVAAYIMRDIERSNGISLEFGLCTNELSGWSAMAIESLFDIIMLYTAFGSAFDKHQAQLYGPIAGAVMIGFNLAILLWVTSGLNQHGYVWGANPAFCMAAAAGRAYWRDTWVSWAGALVSCAVNAVLYVYIPPNHKAVYEERRSLMEKSSFSH